MNKVFALALGMVFKTEAELDKEANRRYIESKLRMYAKNIMIIKKRSGMVKIIITR